MDTTYQDNGIFKAYGLVYLLLQHNIPVDWAIQDPKDYGDVDFTAPSVRTVTASGFGATVFSASYRGGPFVVDSAYYDAAFPWSRPGSAPTPPWRSTGRRPPSPPT